LGKFLSVDPLFHSYPWFTPYQFAGNGPILNIDVDGLENAPTQPNTSGNKVEASDNTNQSTNLSSKIKVTTTYFTPDGGSFQTLQIKNVKNFEKDKDYTLDGNKIQVKENSVKSFEFKGIIYEAQFDKKTGNFTKYLGSDGSSIDYNIKLAPNNLNKTKEASVASPIVITATAVLAAATSFIFVNQTANVVHSITLSKPDVLIGGFVLFKKLTNDAADAWAKEQGYKGAEDLKDAYGVSGDMDIFVDSKTGKGQLRTKNQKQKIDID